MLEGLTAARLTATAVTHADIAKQGIALFSGQDLDRVKRDHRSLLEEIVGTRTRWVAFYKTKAELVAFEITRLNARLVVSLPLARDAEIATL